MTVLIIFPVILQTIINLKMLSVGGEGVDACFRKKTVFNKNTEQKPVDPVPYRSEQKIQIQEAAV